MSRPEHRLPRVRLAGIVVRRGKLLLVRHEREGRSYFLLPGGGLEWGETCAEGLAREFMEELSLEVAVGKLLIANDAIAPGAKRHILNLTFRARIKGGTVKLNPDRRLKGAAWVTPQELMKLTFYPEIRREIVRLWKNGFRQGIKSFKTAWT